MDTPSGLRIARKSARRRKRGYTSCATVWPNTAAAQSPRPPRPLHLLAIRPLPTLHLLATQALGESTNDLPTSARMSPGPAPPPAETTSVVHNARTVSASAQNAGCAGTAERNGVRTAQLGQQMPVRGRSLLTTHPLQSTTVAPPSALATPASGAFRAQERNGASGRAETWSAAGYGTAVILKVPRAREDLEGQRTLVPAESGDGRTCGPELWEVLVAIALLVLLVQWVTGKL
ncbi:hypothetical protein C8Q76DRAFT_424381 [Earliella scabrosa]|nr:hypothetical protein C8Q76DRAFT_424381 [Earliella scabrosa]